MWLVYKGLIAYPHKEGRAGAQLVPGLAEDLPTISEDGKTYELMLRKGLRFSDGTPVKASDFEHTIKRVLNLESGASAFFLGIEGAERYVENRKADADIPGIETDDRSGEITIRLTEPDGTFSNALAMNFAGIVPDNTPFENLTADPPPGVGPYKISESEPNRQFVLEKNHRFNLPGFPKGHLDKITTVIIKSRARAAQDVISGDLDYMFDAPPPDIKPEVKAKYSDRYEEHTHKLHLLPLHEHAGGAVRQKERYVRQSTTGSTNPRWRACSQASSRLAARSCHRGCRATTGRLTPRTAPGATRTSPPTSRRRDR